MNLIRGQYDGPPQESRARVHAALARIPPGTPLIAVVGPTACGKSDVAIRICQAVEGEAVSADSRQVYRGMDLGTGKVRGNLDGARARDVQGIERAYRMAPLVSEGVPHWLLDVADPMDVFTAADFQILAYDAIADIAARGRVPVLVGGTGLYLHAVLQGLVMPSVPPDPALRAELEHLDAATLRVRLLALDADAGAVVDLDNPRRMVRAIEVATAAGPVGQARGTTAVPFRKLTLGVMLERPALVERIRRRLEDRLGQGMVDEVRALLAAGVTPERLEELGLEYRFVGRHVGGRLPYDRMVDELHNAIAKFARRQMTWFRKRPPEAWVASADEAVERVRDFLSRG